MDMSVQKFLKRREVAEASRQLVRAYTTDGMMTYDQMTIDSTGAFLVGQLERLDQTLNEPLVEFTWSRDIDIVASCRIHQPDEHVQHRRDQRSPGNSARGGR
jgi:hypothetical protein